MKFRQVGLVAHFAALVFNFVRYAVTASSWQGNTQSTRDIYLSFGERHTREHFPSSQYLSDALRHQLELLYLKIENVAEQNIEHPFMGCTSYLEYNLLVFQLAELIGDSFQPHLSYTSAIDDLTCFVVFVTDIAALHIYMRSIRTSELSLFIPVPDILKVDHSVLRTIDWITEQEGKPLNVLRNASIDQVDQQRSAFSKHPILEDLANGNPIELSIIFRPTWSSESQEVSASKWFESLHRLAEKTGRTLSDEASHWNSFVWTAAGIHERAHANGDNSSSRLGRRLIEGSVDYSNIYERIMNIPPYEDSTQTMSMFEEDFAGPNKIGVPKIREKWVELQKTFLGLYTNDSMSNNDDNEAENDSVRDECDYASISVEHRKNNVNLLFGSSFFVSTDRSAACLANLIVLLCADNGVSRMALSRPMRTLNNIARKITQSGTNTSEPYSIAGLDGTGVVIGVADTGIDENHCFFKDLKGTIQRSSVDAPYTDLSCRKVVQYVSYSGSNGDYSGGHGTHVAGSVAGMSTDSNSIYGGMASGAKLAFFDIGPITERSGLKIPADLAASLFPPAYSAGAKLHSNSWGGGYFYNSYCIEVDEYLYQHRDFLVLFAAGNDGYKGPGSILSPGLSKNAITVGASYNTLKNMNAMASFSSIGPTFDGRIKPDVAAPGDSIRSADAYPESISFDSCDTLTMSGTSMATPIVAGTAALMIQYFKNAKFWASFCNPAYFLCSNGAFSPLGPTIKALLMHSAVGMNSYISSSGFSIPLTTTPDFNQGYGRIDLLNILPLVIYDKCPYALFLDEAVLTPLTEYTYKVYVKSLSQPLKATISWFDPPNTEFAARVLIHDLDLLLISPSGSIFYGNGGAGIRDELNNNEQIIVTATKDNLGASTGYWTVRVQAKMLPYNGVQAFSLIITADGFIIPPLRGSAPTSISPTILQQCAANLEVGSNPQISLDVSLLSMSSSLAWHVADEVIIRLPSYCEYDILGSVSLNVKMNGTIFVSGISEVSSMSLLEDFRYGVKSSCLSKGCYSASLSLTKDTITSTAAAIPACGVFLAPLRTTQLFCIKDAVQTKVDGSSDVLVFPQKPCYSLCESQSHIKFNAILSAAEGYGWDGAYYAITPKLYGLDLSGARSAYASRKSPGVLKGTANVSAVAAGSLLWNYKVIESICVPVQDYGIPSSTHTLSTDGEGVNLRLKANGSLQNVEQPQGKSIPPSCFSITLSMPITSSIYPNFTFADSWSIPTGKNYYSDVSETQACTIDLYGLVAYGIICVDPARSIGNITFFSRSTYNNIGQKPLYSTYDYLLAYTTYKAKNVGSCGFPITYQGLDFPSNTTTPKLTSGLSSNDSEPATLNTLLSGWVMFAFVVTIYLLS